MLLGLPPEDRHPPGLTFRAPLCLADNDAKARRAYICYSLVGGATATPVASHPRGERPRRCPVQGPRPAPIQETIQEIPMKLTSIGLTVVGLMMLSGTCVMAADSIITAPTNGIGGATQTAPTIPTNPGLPPATPEQSTGRALGTMPPQSPILPDTSGGFSTSPDTSGTALPPPSGGR